MKGVLSACFGTTHEDTRAKTIDAVDRRLAEAFPDRAFYSGWTSSFIVKRLRQRGEWHDTLDEAFARMGDDGVDDVVVATTCLMDGHEMDKVKNAAAAWVGEAEGRAVKVAAPLLSSRDDRRAIARVLHDEFSWVSPDDVVLLMGHGMRAGLQAGVPGEADPNAVYKQMQDELDAIAAGRFVVATVEGQPTFEDALAAIERSGVQGICLAPFMIVAGDHAKNDLAGEDEGSWKNVLEARGYSVQVAMRGLGEYPGVKELVCSHARACIA